MIDHLSSENTSLDSDNIRDIEFNNDGTKMFVLRWGNRREVHQYTLSTAYNPSTKGSKVDLDVSAAGNIISKEWHLMLMEQGCL